MRSSPLGRSRSDASGRCSREELVPLSLRCLHGSGAYCLWPEVVHGQLCTCFGLTAMLSFSTDAVLRSQCLLPLCLCSSEQCSDALWVARLCQTRETLFSLGAGSDSTSRCLEHAPTNLFTPVDPQTGLRRTPVCAGSSVIQPLSCLLLALPSFTDSSRCLFHQREVVPWGMASGAFWKCS